jgi:putative tricarboxylic transport membrane protein
MAHLLRTPAARLVFALLAAVLALGGCTAPSGVPERQLRILVPTTPGGGYDLTARNAAQILRAEAEILVDVFNVSGPGGIVGLNRVVLERGNPDLLLMMGLGLVGGLQTQPSQHTLADATPVARLLEEPEAILVPADSPFATFNDFARSWAQSPDEMLIGGGSALGGPDYLFAIQVADALGVPRPEAGYRTYDGGGDLLPALLTGEIQAAATGLSEYLEQIRSGAVRVLAVSSAQRSPAADAPTLAELGLDVQLVNWRGLYAPPGLSEADRQRLRGLAERLHHSPAWQQILQHNGWSDAFLPGEAFAEYVREQQELVKRTLAQPT